MVVVADWAVGQIEAALDRLGVAETTLLIVASDNGPRIGTNGHKSAGELRGYKSHIWEGGHRIPFIARWPGRIAPGATTDHVSAFWDVLPTLAELTGAASPSDINGVSFLPTLLGEGEQAPSSELYWEYHGRNWGGAQAVRLGDWKGVRHGGHDDPNAPIELYNLATDIGEQHDVAAEHPDVVAQIKAIMESRTVSEIERWNFATGE